MPLVDFVLSKGSAHRARRSNEIHFRHKMLASAGCSATAKTKLLHVVGVVRLALTSSTA